MTSHASYNLILLTIKTAVNEEYSVISTDYAVTVGANEFATKHSTAFFNRVTLKLRLHFMQAIARGEAAQAED